MAIRQIPVRNTVTGQTAELPETALACFADWEPVDPPASADPAPEPETATEAASDSGTTTETKKEGRRRV